MSGFAFSHQFSQRWLTTPAPVKATIIQELDDIVHLLQSDIDVDKFRFSVPNLHDKIEELMALEAIRQQQEEQLRLEQQAREEQQRLENERLAQEKLEQDRLAQEQSRQQEGLQSTQDGEPVEVLENVTVQPDSVAKKATKKQPNTKADTVEVLVKTPVEPALTETTDTLDPTETNSKPELSPDLEAIKQQIIQDLQQQLDGYLSGIKADITAWLDEEVTKQLTAKLAQRG